MLHCNASQAELDIAAAREEENTRWTQQGYPALLNLGIDHEKKLQEVREEAARLEKRLQMEIGKNVMRGEQ